jgi:hypothetical protein
MRELNLKITIKIDGTPNVVCTIEDNGEVVKWEDLDKFQQIKAINSLGQFYTLFYKNFKTNGD